MFDIFIFAQNIDFFFFFFFNSVLRPFQDYFSSYETDQSVGGQNIDCGYTDKNSAMAQNLDCEYPQ